MADQHILPFGREPDDGKLRVQRAIEAARGLTRGTDPDSKAAATAAFEEIEQMAIGCTDPTTQMSAYEASGDFHCGRGAHSIAERKYETAMQSAKLLEVTSDDGVKAVERLRFKLTRVHHTNDQAFGNLEKTAQPLHSYEQRNIAWASYQRDAGNPITRAARGLGSEEYFRGRLDAARSAPSDDEDEDIRW
ncbi:MAG: hypothetical protein WA369_00485 [Candidatus Acidiferrales bacterium]